MTLNIYLLGPVQIKQNDDLIKMRGHKPPALLAYLLLTGQAHSRQQLVDLLFDRSDDPRASLRWTLSQLRRAIGADYIRADRQQVGFNFDSNYWLDVAAFEQGQTDLYRGDFLEGLHVRDAFGFEEWAFFERERLKKCYQTALVRQLEASEVEGDDQAVIEIAHRLLGLANLREEWYRALMRAYARQGQREAALAQFELCRQVLQAELSVEPEIETADLATAIREGAIRETELFRTPQASRPTVPLHNLPAQPTPFVGRETELADLDRLIRQAETRLVTIVGPGGVGKTRLALAVAEYQLTDFGEVTPPATSRPGQPYPDGVFFVPLDFISSIDHIPLALAKALNFRLETSEAAGEQLLSPKQQLLNYLCQKRLLLVIDNFEHLLEGVELLTDILQAASGIKMLVTSRERLQLHEEQLYPLQGLEFPEQEIPEDVTGCTAVTLFLQSARRVQPNFQVAADDLAHLIYICRLVEGLPLALELAAAWVNMLSLADIAAEVQQGLDLLELEVCNVPERHRSIRAVFDSSWQRLAETEREIFMQLSIFRGGFTRAAAKTITGASLHLLMNLANKSLLQYHQNLDRYQIHRLLRQYGLEKLAQDPNNELKVRDRHSAHYCTELHKREIELKGARQQAVLTEIEVEVENVRAAWEWAVTHGQVEQLAPAMDSLGFFLEWRGRYQEGEALFRLAAEKVTTAKANRQQAVLARLITWQSLFNRSLGRIEVTDQLLKQALALLENPDLTDPDIQRGKALALIVSGDMALESGNRHEAKQLYEESLALCRKQNDQWTLANVLEKLASLSWNIAAYREGRQFAEESLSIRQALGDQRGIARSLDRLGLFTIYEGRFEASRKLLQESIVTYQKLGNLSGMATALGNLGSNLILSGKFNEGRRIYEQTLAIFHQLGLRHGVVGTYEVMIGHVDLHLGHYERAKRQAPIALRFAREVDSPRDVADALALLFGELALVEAAYPEAHQYFRESVAIYQGIGQQQDIGISLGRLGLAAYHLGDYAQAYEHVIEALQIATAIEGKRATFTYPLATMALLLVGQGQPEQAVELYALVSADSFVANSRWFDDVVGRHIAAVAATLSPEVELAAQRRGQAGDLRQTATELLNKL